MARGDVRMCMCGCGNPATIARNSKGQNKGWRLYAEGHEPNASVELTIPDSEAIKAYAAGILDGEGCIYASFRQTPKGNSTIVHINISMCCELVISWFLKNFGGTDYAVQR